MAVLQSTDQFKYLGRGPLDSKAIVKNYTDLLLVSTWTTDDTLIAYNGMIVAVWLDSDESKNGIYFLHDKSVTKVLHKPNVTDPANWHKLGGIDNLPGLADQITSIQTDLEKLQGDLNALQDSATEVVELFTQLPEVGTPGKLYVVTEDATTYVWHDGKYLLVGDGVDEADIQIIYGGNAN